MGKVIKKFKTAFTQVPNSIFENGLDPKPIGIYAFILSRHENWEFSIKGTAAALNDGIDSIRTGVHQLEKAGFLRRERRREGTKFSGCDWEIFDEPTFDETPLEKPELEFPVLEKPTLDFPTQEIPTQENPTEHNNIGNNTVLNNTVPSNTENTDTGVSIEIPLTEAPAPPLTTQHPPVVPKKERKKFSAPSLEQVKDFFKEEGYREDSALKAFNHYDKADWHDRNNNPVLNWKQKMRTNWFTDENKIKPKAITPHSVLMGGGGIDFSVNSF